MLTLDLYVQCLHRLERNADYVRIGLKTLAKRIRAKAVIQQQSSAESMKLAHVHQVSRSAANSLSSILDISRLLENQVSLSMDNYFDCIDLGLHVRHSTDDDGFQFPLVLRSLLPESFLAESVRVQILSVEEGQRFELWLDAKDQNIEPGSSRIWLGSNVSPLRSSFNATVADNRNSRCSQPGTS